MSLPGLSALALIVLSAAAGSAWSQDSRTSMSTRGSMADHRGAMSPDERSHFEAARAARIKALHDVLGIRPTQEAAFTAFVTAMAQHERPGSGPGDGRPAPGALLTTPQRLDWMRAEMDRRFAAMRDIFDRRANATKALYGVLDPHQRAVMDALPKLTGKGGAGHMGGMGPHGPRG